MGKKNKVSRRYGKRRQGEPDKLKPEAYDDKQVRRYGSAQARDAEEHPPSPRGSRFASLDTVGATPGLRDSRITRSQLIRAARQLTQNASRGEVAATKRFLNLVKNAEGMSLEELFADANARGKTFQDLISGQVLQNQGQREFVQNTLFSRVNLLDQFLDPRRDIDRECGYPVGELLPWAYRLLYLREGIARRVVEILPDESWQKDPLIFEDEDSDTETPFEKEWDDLRERLAIFRHLHKIDQISGIGRYGVLLLGLDDGKDLAEPVEGINERGEPTGEGGPKQLVYLRGFDEALCYITAREGDFQNPRYSQPRYYNLIFRDLQGANAGGIGGPGGVEGWGSGGGTIIDITKRVHWSRVIHVADNRQLSEIFGIPRMQPVVNRLVDIRKVLSGSGEMFWKGAFPGFSFELNPGVGDVEVDIDKLREEMEHYQGGLQRYLAVIGMTCKSLAPQVADPSGHVDKIVEHIAMTLGCPLRIFKGSEQAHLASTQDQETWAARVAGRQEHYVTPCVLREVVERLVAVGVVPEPKDGYTIEWPDLNLKSDTEAATIALTKTQAMQAYVAGNVDQIMPPPEWLTHVMDMDPDQVEQIMDSVDDYHGDKIEQIAERTGKMREELTKQGIPTPDAMDGDSPGKQTGGAGAGADSDGNPTMAGPNSSGLVGGNPTGSTDLAVRGKKAVKNSQGWVRNALGLQFFSNNQGVSLYWDPQRPWRGIQTTGNHVVKVAGGYQLRSIKKSKKTGKSKNLGSFKTRGEALKHEAEVEYFKQHPTTSGSNGSGAQKKKRLVPKEDRDSKSSVVGEGAVGAHDLIGPGVA